MPPILGLQLSHQHPENGMTLGDMAACVRVAERHNEVIIFRSTGPWAKRWIERGYPTKNFHVKGKSSDWGPHAGLVPCLGVFSKVGHDPAKAEKGTRENESGIRSGFAAKTVLTMSRAQISEAETRMEEDPPRTAVDSVEEIAHSGGCLLIVATRPADQAKFAFVARPQANGDYTIGTYGTTTRSANPFVVRQHITSVNGPREQALEVMASKEVGANTLPMTGDYDLFAVCPTWADYGRMAHAPISKRDLLMWDPRSGLRRYPGPKFAAAVNMDKVLEPRLHTMGRVRDHERQPPADDPWREHPDMGNLTPRVLRCINALNAEMAAGAARDVWNSRRRVHHNAEALRNYRFGALTGRDMRGRNEGFPLTAFQPQALSRTMGRFSDVCVTLETYADFEQYAAALHAVGFYVPKNWVWNMPSIWADRKAALSRVPAAQLRAR